MRLHDKVVVVTGAGSGIGRQLVLELFRRRARAAAVDLSEVRLASTARLAREQGQELATFCLDVADRGAVEALPGKVVERLGQVDGLINCAGIIQPFLRVQDLDYATIERVFDTNWRGPLYMTKAFLPFLLARPEAHLANVSSMGGFLPVPGQTAYGASKAAVKLFTEGLHAELADTNVHVTVVLPGAIDTDIAVNSGVAIPVAADDQRAAITQADKAARAILEAMEHNRFRVLIGQDASMFDAFYRLAPHRAAHFIAGQMKRLLEPKRSSRGPVTAP